MQHCFCCASAVAGRCCCWVLNQQYSNTPQSEVWQLGSIIRDEDKNKRDSLAADADDVSLAVQM